VSSCAGGTDTVYFDKRIDDVNPVNCENRITQPAPQRGPPDRGRTNFALKGFCEV
jgi:hypothetical protein